MKSKNLLSAMIFLMTISLFIFGCKAEEKEPVAVTSDEIADSGLLVVESSPSFAQVYVGEEFKGDTPVTLYNLPVGKYDIKVKKDGYADFETTATVRVGMTEEVDAELTPLTPSTLVQEKKAIEEKPIIDAVTKNLPADMPKPSKINLSSFAMYYDFDKMQFTELRTDGSDLYSKKYQDNIEFVTLVPAKLHIVNKPIKDILKEDCIFSETGFGRLLLGQTLCVKTGFDNVVAIGGNWQTSGELELVSFS